VAGHFMPEVGYQEVYLARACSRLGHDVRVVTSDRVSPSARGVLGRRYEPGLSVDATYGFSVLRLRAPIQIGALVLAPGLRRAIEEYAPQIVMVMGVGKLFPYPVLSSRKRYKLVALFGDNSDFWDFSSASLGLRSLRSKVSQRALKDVVYRRAVKHADRISLSTPETKGIVASSLSPRLRRALEHKHFLAPLGFDSDEFFFCEDDREQGRTELEASAGECVFITCTRVKPKKSLERVVDGVSKLRADGHKVRYVIAGFVGGAYEDKLKAHIARQASPEIFHCLPFLDHATMRRLYCSADVGIWLKAAISIQESMGTGLPVLLEDKPSVSHLVQDGVNGWRFNGNELVAAMEAAVGAPRLPPREEIAASNQERLGYDHVTKALIASLSTTPRRLA
jgi:glycosyltransferase involved in cell wall biosynthesis